MPLGWAKFVAAPADALADAVVDGQQHEAFAAFRPLADTLFGPEPDVEGELARISALLSRAGVWPMRSASWRCTPRWSIPTFPPSRNWPSGWAPDRTVERACARAFGFSPKLLLRRQRFIRSLSQYMLDPSLKWIGALDGHYHDQAQFVREFREFMGMTPRQYGKLEHPILGAMRDARLAGAAMQALDTPDGAAAALGAEADPNGFAAPGGLRSPAERRCPHNTGQADDRFGCSWNASAGQDCRGD
jgi:hypothetical protein